MTARPAVQAVGQAQVTLFGLTPFDRLARMAARAGLAAADSTAATPAVPGIVLVRLDHVLEEILLKRLAERRGVLLVRPGAGGQRIAVAAHVDAADAAAVSAALAGGAADDPRLAGLEPMSAETLASSYNSALRKREPPFVLPLDGMTPGQIERRLFNAAYKGVTDFVTKYLWPWPALAATRWAARRKVSPNTVTAVSLIFVLVALVLFGIGQFALGLVAAWIMTFLDTVDGKLARVTLTSSKWGNVFDHGIDLIHPPLWWLAWWYGLLADPAPLLDRWLLDAAMWVVVIGYLIGRGIEGFFLWRFKLEIHAWRRVDSLFRLVTARRNPNLVLLTAFVIGGRADLGFVAVAAWTIASLAFHGVRVAQAIRRSRAERGLRSWLSEPAPGRPALSEPARASA